MLTDRKPGEFRARVAAGDTDAEQWIGGQIRDLRKAQKLTLKDIAARTGLSIGFLSQVERGLSTPSIKHLQDISAALGVTIGWFFNPEAAAPAAERGIVVRATRRKKLTYGSLGVTDQLLSPSLAGRLELLLCELAPGAGSGDEPYTHEGEEAALILRGQLELWVGDSHFLLEAGDSFGFPSTTPHRYRNPGQVQTVIVWSITPPSF